MANGGVIHWFRKGLRLHDNPALISALESKLKIYPIFILDPWFVKNARVGVNRWRFLQQTLADLDQQLRALGSRLLVVRGKPEEKFPDLIKRWNIHKLTYEVDTEPYAKMRDQKVNSLAAEHKVDVSTHVSHTLFDVTKIINKNKGQPPLTYQKLESLIASLGPPPKSIDVPTLILAHCQMPKNVLENEEFDVPMLEELNVRESDLNPCLYKGGETEGLKRLKTYISEEKKNWVADFEKPKTSPNSLEPSTTVLSPYLKFGCVSPRLFYERLQMVYVLKPKHSKPPVSLYGQLLWREFFYTCGSVVQNFDQIKGNPICRQINWDTNPEYLAAWRESRTGFPYIDAIMTQLRDEGWVHHLARHSVACFLTRGDLYISWVEGMKVFEEYLLDADWSLNAANWMWLSASAFFHQYFRVYSPIAFGKKTDPRGLYIKKYLPKLAKLPDKYIYEPWDAPLDVQKRAGCIIGKDYPRPIVDHSKISKINMGRMKEIFNKNKSESGGSRAKSSASSSSKGKRKSESSDGPSSSTSKKMKNASGKKKNTIENALARKKT